MNIVLTIMAGGRHPVQVAIKQQDGLFTAKILGPNPVEVSAQTFNGAIDAISKRAAYSADVAA